MEINRTVQPPVFIPEVVKMPAVKFHTTGNGVDLYTLRSGDIEVIRLSLVFRAGSSHQSQPFSASATVSMLAEGTDKYTADEIAEKFDFLGSVYEVNIDRDYSIITVCCLSKFFGQTLELLEDVLLHPAFPEREFSTYVSKRKQKLSVERKKVSFQAREIFGRALFGQEHPYGSFYDASVYDELNTDHLKEFHKKHYTAENCFAVSSGFIGDADIAAIDNLLSKIPSGGRVDTIAFPPVKTTPYEYIEQEGAVQSAIRIGRLMFPRSHPDYVGMQVLCTVLGGYFGSRLVANLREDKGYTYGIFSAMANMDHDGYMAVGTEVGAQFTDDAVKEILAEIDRLRTEIIPEDELSVVKSMIAGELMRLLDGPFGIADITIENIQSEFNNDYVTDFIRKVNRTTSQELLDLAKKYLDPKDFITVIVGKK